MVAHLVDRPCARWLAATRQRHCQPRYLRGKRPCLIYPIRRALLDPTAIPKPAIEGSSGGRLASPEPGVFELRAAAGARIAPRHQARRGLGVRHEKLPLSSRLRTGKARSRWSMRPWVLGAAYAEEEHKPFAIGGEHSGAFVLRSTGARVPCE